MLLKSKVKQLIMKSILRKEKVFNEGECKLKYLFLPNKKSDKLLVVFSGFPPNNQSSRYNYVLNFRDLKCNKLYILDDAGDDPRGTYYLGKNKDFFIERTVKKLIDKVSADIKISKKDIITTGTSKGGYAGLYFSFKYGYGTTVVGGPQILLGDFLSHPSRRSILTYISGDDQREDINFTNKILLEVIQSSKFNPEVYVHVSKNEPHYEDHVRHLMNVFDNMNYPYDLDLGTYQRHPEVGEHYSVYAKGIIRSIIE